MDIFKRLKKYILNIPKYQIIIYVLSTIFFIGLDIIMPYLNGYFIDLVISVKDKTYAINFVVFITTISVFSIIINYIKTIINIKVQSNIAFEFNSDIIKHMQKIPLKILEGFDSTYLSERINSSVNEISSFFLDNIIIFSFQWVFILIQLFFIYKINIFIFYLSILFIPLYIIIFNFTKKPIFNRSYELNEGRSIFFQQLTDQLEMANNIKIEGTFQQNEDRLRKRYSRYLKLSLSYYKFMTFLSSLNNTINIVFRAILMVFSTVEIIEGNMTIGQFTIVNSYFSIIISSIKYYLDIASKYQKVKSSLHRVDELLNIEAENNGLTVLDDISTIGINNITFKYNTSNKTIINNMEYIFIKGKIYLIKGNNGSGKSTLINILIGIIQDISMGFINYNGININSIDLYNNRLKNMSIVQQKIKFSNINVSELLKEVYFYKEEKELFNYIVEKRLDKLFISTEFNIFNYLNTLAIELSGGELQKIAILRALLKDSEVLIFDEPTSAFDSSSIDVLKLTLIDICKNKIIIIITHDSSLEEIADEIIVL